LAKAKLFDALRWLIDLELLKDLIGLNDRFCHSIAYDESVCKGLETALPCMCLPGKTKTKTNACAELHHRMASSRQ
jgi:hypothetical protein